MANKHLIKLWIITLLLAPFVFAFYEIAIGVEEHVATLLEMLPITLMFSVVLSLPTLLIAVMTNMLTLNLNLPNRVRKLINIFLATIGLLITLLIVQGSLVPTLIKTYLISLAIASIIIELVFKSSIIKD